MVLDKPGPDQPSVPLVKSMIDTTTELTSVATEYVSGQQITFTAKFDTTAQEQKNLQVWLISSTGKRKSDLNL